MFQCAHRFEELKTSGVFPHTDNQCNSLTEANSSPSNDTLLDTEDVLKMGIGSIRKAAGQSVFAGSVP